jgi:hypothetical protein
MLSISFVERHRKFKYIAVFTKKACFQPIQGFEVWLLHAQRYFIEVCCNLTSKCICIYATEQLQENPLQVVIEAC